MALWTLLIGPSSFPPILLCGCDWQREWTRNQSRVPTEAAKHRDGWIWELSEQTTPNIYGIINSRVLWAYESGVVSPTHHPQTLLWCLSKSWLLPSRDDGTEPESTLSGTNITLLASWVQGVYFCGNGQSLLCFCFFTTTCIYSLPKQLLQVSRARRPEDPNIGTIAEVAFTYTNPTKFNRSGHGKTQTLQDSLFLKDQSLSPGFGLGLVANLLIYEVGAGNPDPVLHPTRPGSWVALCAAPWGYSQAQAPFAPALMVVSGEQRCRHVCIINVAVKKEEHGTGHRGPNLSWRAGGGFLGKGCLSWATRTSRWLVGIRMSLRFLA